MAAGPSQGIAPYGIVGLNEIAEGKVSGKEEKKEEK